MSDRPANPDGVLVEVAYREVLLDARARGTALARPSIEQVCAELWRMGVTMPMADVLQQLAARGLTVSDAPPDEADPTRKLPRSDG